MTISTTAEDALLNCLMRVLVERAGGAIMFSMADVHAAAAAGELRYRMNDDGSIVVQIMKPQSDSWRRGARAAA